MLTYVRLPDFLNFTDSHGNTKTVRNGYVATL